MPVGARLLITARACDVIVGRPEHAKTIKQVGGSSGRIYEGGGFNQVTWLKQLADHQGRAAAADESYIVHGKPPFVRSYAARWVVYSIIGCTGLADRDPLSFCGAIRTWRAIHWPCTTRARGAPPGSGTGVARNN
jgi:hypothetical protein